MVHETARPLVVAGRSLGEGVFWGTVCSATYGVLVGVGLFALPAFHASGVDEALTAAGFIAAVFTIGATVGAVLGLVAGLVVGAVSGVALAVAAPGRPLAAGASLTFARVVGGVSASLTMAALGAGVVLYNLPDGHRSTPGAPRRIPVPRFDMASVDLAEAGILLATLALVPAVVAGAVFAWRSPAIVRSGLADTPRLATPDERRNAVARMDAQMSGRDFDAE